MGRIPDNLLMIGAILIGLLISVVTSETHSVKIAVARISSGLFCGIFLTHPILDWLGRDPEVYGNGLAGLLAISGYAFTRILANLDWKKIQDIIHTTQGKSGK